MGYKNLFQFETESLLGTKWWISDNLRLYFRCLWMSDIFSVDTALTALWVFYMNKISFVNMTVYDFYISPVYAQVKR